MAYLSYIQVALSIFLIAGVLLQRSEAGLGAGFGSEGSGGHFMRRGFENFLFKATIVIAVLFALSTLAPLLVG